MPIQANAKPFTRDVRDAFTSAPTNLLQGFIDIGVSIRVSTVSGSASDGGTFAENSGIPRG
jgi:hypothetical protein